VSAGLLETEFADWTITFSPGGLDAITAERTGPDGSVRSIVAPTPGELLAKLRAIRDQEEQGEGTRSGSDH
jgi:hypothetical protein